MASFAVVAAAPAPPILRQPLWPGDGRRHRALKPAARALVGHRVELCGFMAPPLKANSDCFVLTRYPMSICPFCSNAADWPVDIIMVRLGAAAETIEPSYAIDVPGTLEHGMKMDQETGFVSLVRIVDAVWRRV